MTFISWRATSAPTTDPGVTPIIGPNSYTALHPRRGGYYDAVIEIAARMHDLELQQDGMALNKVSRGANLLGLFSRLSATRPEFVW